ncbi:MAG: HIT family protein [Paludibacterium sp.]|uniref:HIT family protein n=1 Tax=Paludibacterium sp. TaxID=1917523 RepID=UPI0025D9F3FC|nr:HIT family protein [Paludibacterium sp.]MBV8047327.1 HIT family protein [Paludibacterium sp.]MBV8648053.1 HIT family protein [Paludibacterium sp.]
MDCIFCQIVNQTAPSHRIWEDDKHLAFLSIFPNTPGFSVVIPKQHYPSYAFDLPDGVLADLAIAAKKVGKLLDAAFDDVARTGMMFEGYGVDHVHAKLFPMHGTGRDSAFKPLSSKVDKFFAHYEGYLSSHDWQRADDAALAELAARIRATARA